MLPGYGKRLPEAAQDLIERALLDDDLAGAPADDARWVQLYDDLQRLVKERSTSSTSPVLGDAADHDKHDDETSSFQWGSSDSSDEDATTTTTTSPSHHPALSQDTREQSRYTSLLPSRNISDAVHRYTSQALTNKKGALPKNVTAESWDPASLAALSILVEEVAKSQAHFNAQRTMFAKSPRNQALAAKRQAQKGNGKAKEDGEAASD